MARVFGKESVRIARANNAALRALDVNCDPTPMIDLFKRSDWWGGHPKPGGVISVNGLEAMLAAGLEAVYLPPIQKMEAALPEKTDPASRCYILLLVSRAHTQLESWTEAIRTQNEAMDCFNRLPASRRGREDLQWQLCLNGYTLRLHQGQTDGLEELCRLLVESAPSPHLENEARFLLGRLLAALGRDREGEEQLEWVVKNGNKLHCRREAEVLLCELRGTELTGAARTHRACRARELLAVQRNPTLDPEPFLEISREALSHPEVLAEREAAATLRLQAAADLVNLGRYEEAWGELEALDLTRPLERQTAVQLWVLYLRTVVEVGRDHLDQAVRLQNEAVALFEKGNAAPWRWNLTYSGLSLQIKLGQLEGLEERVRELLETAPDETGQMFAHMRLARYLLAAGRGEEARPHLEYVAERGGKHHFQAEAVALLGR